MENFKEEGVFKIYFKGTELEANQQFNLSFYYHSDNVEDFKDFQTFMLNYNQLTREKQNNSFSNIIKVVTFGNIKEMDIQNYYVILRTVSNNPVDDKENKERQGYLIVRTKKNEHLVVGYWPFPYFTHHREINLNPSINLKNMLQQPEKYNDILMVT
ncbi:MAG: hypothetical protein ACTSYI_08280 [Promethearchaeota archaeon]